MEVLKDGISKRTAVETLQTHYQLRREEIVACGGYHVDLEMLQYVGLGIAMGSAPEVVRAAADRVTASNDGEGGYIALGNLRFSPPPKKAARFSANDAASVLYWKHTLKMGRTGNMKRSEINRAIRRMEQLAAAHGFCLPPFCGWTPEDWTSRDHEYDEIRDNLLGWDVTDYGTGDFFKIGFTLITLRNGNVKAPKQYPKPYAEKLLMLEEGQYSPMHFHWNKMEDIINRGGGSIFIRVYRSAPDEMFDNCDVRIYKDGRAFFVPAGTQVRLDPGESISIYPYLYHDFEVVPGTGAVLLGEVSMCNDDENDNRFYEKLGRFPEIEEDEPPYRLLCTEYPRAKEG